MLKAAPAGMQSLIVTPLWTISCGQTDSRQRPSALQHVELLCRASYPDKWKRCSSLCEALRK